MVVVASHHTFGRNRTGEMRICAREEGEARAREAINLKGTRRVAQCPMEASFHGGPDLSWQPETRKGLLKAIHGTNG